jgi:hypothetical protein
LIASPAASNSSIVSTFIHPARQGHGHSAAVLFRGEKAQRISPGWEPCYRSSGCSVDGLALRPIVAPPKCTPQPSEAQLLILFFFQGGTLPELDSDRIVRVQGGPTVRLSQLDLTLLTSKPMYSACHAARRGASCIFNDLGPNGWGEPGRFQHPPEQARRQHGFLVVPLSTRQVLCERPPRCRRRTPATRGSSTRSLALPSAVPAPRAATPPRRQAQR